jgi:hypothetical protein
VRRISGDSDHTEDPVATAIATTVEVRQVGVKELEVASSRREQEEDVRDVEGG